MSTPLFTGNDFIIALPPIPPGKYLDDREELNIVPPIPALPPSTLNVNPSTVTLLVSPTEPCGFFNVPPAPPLPTTTRSNISRSREPTQSSAQIISVACPPSPPPPPR